MAFPRVLQRAPPLPVPEPYRGRVRHPPKHALPSHAGQGSYYSDDDVEVKEIEVSVLSLFDALQSNTTGEVQISFRMPGTGSATKPDQILAEIDVLVVGV